MNKKILVALVGSILVLNLSACGKSEKEKKAEESKNSMLGEKLLKD